MNNQNVVDPQMAQNNMNQMNQQANINQNPNQGAFLSNPYINQNQLPMNANGIANNPYVNQNANVQNDPNNQMMQNAQNDSFINGDFVKGALIGAGVAFLLTNKTTQEAIFNGFSKGSELVQAGIEELKERMEDAKAQMEAKEF